VPEVDDGLFWLVDPLDGTKEFISRNGEFTVNIALVEGRDPVLGVVLAPARGKVWWGAVGHGAMMRDAAGERPIAVRKRPAEGAVAVASRSHSDAATEAFLDEQRVAERISAGSSLKFCLVAEGRADLYPRFGPTMEWDTAAGNAVLAAAGGKVTTTDGAPFRYRKPGFRNPEFIASGA
jgi:3'(2'), 5'-bisphosphate nucleotidase